MRRKSIMERTRASGIGMSHAVGKWPICVRKEEVAQRKWESFLGKP